MMLPMLQRCNHLLQLRLEYGLVLGIVGSAMTIGTHGDDRIGRIRSPLREPIKVMHLKRGLVLQSQKRGRSTTAFTSPASTPQSIGLDPLASLTKSGFTLNSCGGWPGIVQSRLRNASQDSCPVGSTSKSPASHGASPDLRSSQHRQLWAAPGRVKMGGIPVERVRLGRLLTVD